jgi:hypothetical protein
LLTFTGQITLAVGGLHSAETQQTDPEKTARPLAVFFRQWPAQPERRQREYPYR